MIFFLKEGTPSPRITQLRFPLTRILAYVLVRGGIPCLVEKILQSHLFQEFTRPRDSIHEFPAVELKTPEQGCEILLC